MKPVKRGRIKKRSRNEKSYRLYGTEQKSQEKLVENKKRRVKEVERHNIMHNIRWYHFIGEEHVVEFSTVGEKHQVFRQESARHSASVIFLRNIIFFLEWKKKIRTSGKETARKKVTYQIRVSFANFLFLFLFGDTKHQHIQRIHRELERLERGR